MAQSARPIVPPNDNLMPDLWGNGRLLPTIGIRQVKNRLLDKKDGFYNFKFRGVSYDFLKFGQNIYAIDPRAQAGHGGMSELFYAQNIETGTWKIAKKMVNKNKTFRNHSTILQELKRSPLTVTIDSKKSDRPHNVRYMLMDLEEGTDLITFLKNYLNGPYFSYLFLIQISINILKAYQDLHDQGLLHLDPKFDNIMINPITGAVKIIDFDFSKKLSYSQTKVHITKLTDMPGGTIEYASPEVIPTDNFTSAVIDETTDNYSVGLILKRLLLGDKYVRSAYIDNERKFLRGEHHDPNYYACFKAVCENNDEYEFKNILNLLTSDKRKNRPSDLKATIKYFEEFYTKKITKLASDPLLQYHVTNIKKHTAAEIKKDSERSADITARLKAKHLDQQSIATAVESYNTQKKNQYFSYIRLHFFTSAISTNTASFLSRQHQTLTDDDRYAIVKNYILANHDRALAKQFARMEALTNDPEINALYSKKNRL